MVDRLWCFDKFKSVFKPLYKNVLILLIKYIQTRKLNTECLRYPCVILNEVCDLRMLFLPKCIGRPLQMIRACVFNHLMIFKYSLFFFSFLISLLCLLFIFRCWMLALVKWYGFFDRHRPTIMRPCWFLFFSFLFFHQQWRSFSVYLKCSITKGNYPMPYSINNVKPVFNIETPLSGPKKITSIVVITLRLRFPIFFCISKTIHIDCMLDVVRCKQGKLNRWSSMAIAPF